MSPIITRPRGSIATRDPHPGDARVVEHDPEERESPFARRGRYSAAEQQRAIGAEVFDQRPSIGKGDKGDKGDPGVKGNAGPPGTFKGTFTTHQAYSITETDDGIELTGRSGATTLDTGGILISNIAVSLRIDLETEIRASGPLDLKSSATANLEASGTVIIKGAASTSTRTAIQGLRARRVEFDLLRR